MPVQCRQHRRLTLRRTPVKPPRDDEQSALLLRDREVARGYAASTVTSAVTEFAIKHSAWARSWSAAISSGVGDVVPPNVSFGRRMTRVIASFPFDSSLKIQRHDHYNHPRQTFSSWPRLRRLTYDNSTEPRRGHPQDSRELDCHDRRGPLTQAREHHPRRSTHGLDCMTHRKNPLLLSSTPA